MAYFFIVPSYFKQIPSSIPIFFHRKQADNILLHYYFLKKLSRSSYLFPFSDLKIIFRNCIKFSQGLNSRWFKTMNYFLSYGGFLFCFSLTQGQEFGTIKSSWPQLYIPSTLLPCLQTRKARMDIRNFCVTSCRLETLMLPVKSNGRVS